MVGTTIVVPYNSFAVAVLPRFWVVVIRLCYTHTAPLGLSAKTEKRGNGIVLIRIGIVGTTIVVPYNSFAVAVPPRLWVVVIRLCYTHTAPLGYKSGKMPDLRVDVQVTAYGVCLLL